MASASSQSYTSLGGSYLQFPWTEEGEGLGGEELEEELMFDIDVDLAAKSEWKDASSDYAEDECRIYYHRPFQGRCLVHLRYHQSCFDIDIHSRHCVGLCHQG